MNSFSPIEEIFGSSLNQTPADLFRDDRERYRECFDRFLATSSIDPNAVLPEPWYFRRLAELAAHVECLVAGTLRQPQVHIVSEQRALPRIACHPALATAHVAVADVSFSVPVGANVVA